MHAFVLLAVAVVLAACASPSPYKTVTGGDDVICGVEAAVTDEACFARTPEVAEGYTLHFVEFDDQGWLYPAPGDDGYGQGTGTANGQLDRAVTDVASRLKNGERVLLLVYVHGWRHGAAHDDRDVRRFRQMLSDAALLDPRGGGAGSADAAGNRRVVGIYVGWRGAGRYSRTNPLVFFSFWTRKNAALHISEGASRELFARIHALRQRWNAAEDGSRPRLRTVVIGHSFGAWVTFSALSPSILELMAQRVDIAEGGASDDAATGWRRARLKSAADVIVLLNPAFEATRYQALHKLAQRVGLFLTEYDPPVLLLVTSTADAATRTGFPIGRFLNTLFQRPFVSGEQRQASTHTPGFVDGYVTHRLDGGGLGGPTDCAGWRAGAAGDSGKETEASRQKMTMENATLEMRRHREWRAHLANSSMSLSKGWSWHYCGGTTITHTAHAPHTPVWNVVTDGEVIPNHSDIMGESLHAFLRQLYLDLPF